MEILLGVPGIGPKTAAALINEFGTLDNLLNNLDKIPQKKRRETLELNIDKAKLSRALVELNRNVPEQFITGFPDNIFLVSQLRMEPINTDRLFSFYDAMGFKALKHNLSQKLKGVKVGRRPTSTKPKREKTTIPKPEDYADVPF